MIKDEVEEEGEKIYFTTSDLKKTADNEYMCLNAACDYVARTAQNTIMHVQRNHPQFVHRPRTLKKGVPNSPGVGIKTWTEEELADKSKRLYYTTSNLVREDGKYKCFCCPYSSPAAQDVSKHIAAHHPRFIHKCRIAEKKKLEKVAKLGINTWTKKDYANPNKKLVFMTSNLEREEDGRYKCFICPFITLSSKSVVHHITRKHPRFVHKPVVKAESRNTQRCPRKGIKTWTKEELSDPNKTLFYRTADLEKENGKFICFICSFSCVRDITITRHIAATHSRFIHRKKEMFRFDDPIKEAVAKARADRKGNDPWKYSETEAFSSDDEQREFELKLKESSGVRERAGLNPSVLKNHFLRKRKSKSYNEDQLTTSCESSRNEEVVDEIEDDDCDENGHCDSFTTNNMEDTIHNELVKCKEESTEYAESGDVEHEVDTDIEENIEQSIHAMDNPVEPFHYKSEFEDNVEVIASVKDYKDRLLNADCNPDGKENNLFDDPIGEQLVVLRIEQDIKENALLAESTSNEVENPKCEDCDAYHRLNLPQHREQYLMCPNVVSNEAEKPILASGVLDVDRRYVNEIAKLKLELEKRNDEYVKLLIKSKKDQELEMQIKLVKIRTAKEISCLDNQLQSEIAKVKALRKRAKEREAEFAEQLNVVSDEDEKPILASGMLDVDGRYVNEIAKLKRELEKRNDEYFKLLIKSKKDQQMERQIKLVKIRTAKEISCLDNQLQSEIDTVKALRKRAKEREAEFAEQLRCERDKVMRLEKTLWEKGISCDL